LSSSIDGTVVVVIAATVEDDDDEEEEEEEEEEDRDSVIQRNKGAPRGKFEAT